MATAAEKGIVKGNGGKALLHEQLTRGQFALLLMRALQLGNEPVRSVYLFQDVKQQDVWKAVPRHFQMTGRLTQQPKPYRISKYSRFF